jgi:two-component sensor histidine kinase
MPLPEAADGVVEKSRAELCLEALDGASADEQAFHLDAALSGLRIIATNGFQELSLESLEGAARLKGRAIRHGEFIIAPDESGLEKTRQLLIEAREAGDLIAEAHLLSLLSHILNRLGRNDEIEAIVQRLKALPIADRPHVQQDILFEEHRLLRARGDTVAALENMEALISLYEENYDETLAGRANYGIGNIVYDLGDYEAALARYRAALAALNRDTSSTDALIGLVRLAIGTVLTDLERHEEAVEELEKAILINEKVGNGRELSLSYFSLAKSLYALGDEAGALDTSWRAARVSPEQRSPAEAANILVWTAARELERDDTTAAFEALELAASLVDVGSDEDPRTAFEGERRYVAVSYARNMSELMERLGRNEEALRFARYALDAHADWLEAEKVQATVDAETLFAIRNNEQKIQLLENERSLQQAAIELRDAELEKQRLRTIAGLMGAGGLALISLLVGYGWYSSRRVAALRKTLVAEEHHRTKNALQIASSLIRAETGEAVRNRLVTMGLVYDHLRQKQASSVLTADPFLRELIDYLTAALAPKNVKAHLRCDVETLHASVAMPIGLLVCEMVINSCKHAFPSTTGRIDITLTESNGARTLIVADDGIGDAQSTEKPDEPVGTGYKLIQDLALQLGAEAVLTQDAKGTRWTVTQIPKRTTAA